MGEFTRHRGVEEYASNQTHTHLQLGIPSFHGDIPVIVTARWSIGIVVLQFEWWKRVSFAIVALDLSE